MGWLGKKRPKKVQDKVVGLRLKASSILWLIKLLRFMDPSGYYHGQLIMDMERQLHKELGLRGKIPHDKKPEIPISDSG